MVLAVHKLADHAGREVGRHCLGYTQGSRAAIWSTLPERRSKVILPLPSDDRREVEHVARLQARAAVVDLLRDDLTGCLEQDLARPHGDAVGWTLGDRGAADEIDLADVAKCQLEYVTTVRVVAVGRSIKCIALRSGIEKG